MNSNVCLKDSQGRILQKQILQHGEQKEFDLEKLHEGIYVVELKMANGKSIRHQIAIAN